MSGTRFTPKSIGFVRAWVRLYTAGLPLFIRDSRREEIDADLWEQLNENKTSPGGNPSLTMHVLLRWLMGLPDDLLWRLANIRAKNIDQKEEFMVQTRNYMTLTVITGVVMTILLFGLLAWTVLENIEYYRQIEFAYLPHWSYVLSVYGPISLASIVGGFWFMRKAPMLGAILVAAGSTALAIMLYWLILPVLFAVGVSFYAFRRAYRIEAGG